MATGKTYFARPNYRFLSGDPTAVGPADSAFELDESDLYFSASARSDSTEFRRPARPGRKTSSKHGDLIDRPRAAAPSSLPVNIPDWSKILREEFRDSVRRRGDSLDNVFDDGEDGDEDEEAGDIGFGNRLPPHEFLARQMARTRIGSFSVHEGVGRTLKGRDLSRVRNAVWARTGFED
ncbi:uncharacterized protein LOC116210030 [Punica granatum]|uniref:Senescence regulator S40 n=2 Tax=Punica granatum TaxID=22663 RepID=A0A218W8C8_PUNGR|nr:uncharacterized protein LOC116210030 [Punica granatum]OWM68896.1 hypothetical protein CDL15_Pgr025083 [Punica granatum]PKI51971.1 hypothetical protein CRG98_027623 [Punica granatum]